MKSKNNLVKQVNHRLTQMNNNIRDQVQNQLVVNTLRVLLIIYAAFIVPMLKDKHVKVIDQQVVRFIVVAIIIYLSFIDLPSAILLTIAFLLTLQRVNSSPSAASNSHIKDVSLNTLIKNLNNEVKQIPVQNVANNNQGNNNQRNNNKGNNNVANNHAVINDNTIENFEAHNNLLNGGATAAANNGATANNNGAAANNATAANNGQLPGMPTAQNAGLVDEQPPGAYDKAPVNNLQVYDASNAAVKQANVNVNSNSNKNIDALNNQQPASETLTEGILRAQGAQRNNNPPMGLTTGDDLYAISENAVPQANIMGEVKTFQEQHSTQNLGKPMGLGAKRYDGYHFRDERHPNLKHDMLRNENL